MPTHAQIAPELEKIGTQNEKPGDLFKWFAQVSFCNACYTLGDPATIDKHENTMVNSLGDALLKDFEVGDVCTSSTSRYKTISEQEVRVTGFADDKVQVIFLTGPRKDKAHQFKKKDLKLQQRADHHVAGIPSSSSGVV